MPTGKFKPTKYPICTVEIDNVEMQLFNWWRDKAGVNERAQTWGVNSAKSQVERLTDMLAGTI